jgi:hypothetical protein
MVDEPNTEIEDLPHTDFLAFASKYKGSICVHNVLLARLYFLMRPFINKMKNLTRSI